MPGSISRRRKATRRRLLAAGIILSVTAPGRAGDALPQTPMRLGAAGNFAQGWNDTTYHALLQLPLHRLRDAVRWAEVERSPGVFTFNTRKANWPDRFNGRDVQITLTLTGGNPLYDGGTTPHSPEALTAFGRFAAAVVQRFPMVDTIEIGNEFNSNTFVTGKVKDDGLEARARYHLATVQAAAQAVKAVKPNVRVIGGSVHSIPAGYLWPMLNMPEAKVLDGLALHPYTTPIDQLPAQIGFLRRDRAAAALPLFITEYGTEDASLAADHLVRGYVTLAALGAAEFDWYPLNERGDGTIPLVRQDGSLTEAGRAFRFIQQHLYGRPAIDISPDRFTFVRQFGQNAMVLWGAQRLVSLSDEGIKAFDATGAVLDRSSLTLQPDRALILLSADRLTLDRNVHLGCSDLVADSFYQFAYLPGGAFPNADNYISSHIQIGGRPIPFENMPGQQRRGVPWTPYLGLRDNARLQMMADQMVPSFKTPGTSIVSEYTSKIPRTVRIHATFAPPPGQEGRLSVALLLDGKELSSQDGANAIVIDRTIAMTANAHVSLNISAAEPSDIGKTPYRISVHDMNICKKLGLVFSEIEQSSDSDAKFTKINGSDDRKGKRSSAHLHDAARLDRTRFPIAFERR